MKTPTPQAIDRTATRNHRSLRVRRWALGFFLGASFCLVIGADAHAQNAPKPSRYEYCVRDGKFNNRVLERMLNDYAAQGWELVQIERGIAIFRRVRQ